MVCTLTEKCTQKVQKHTDRTCLVFFISWYMNDVDDAPFFMIYFWTHFYFSKKPFCINVFVDKVLLAKALSSHSFHKSFKRTPFQWIFISISFITFGFAKFKWCGLYKCNIDLQRKPTKVTRHLVRHYSQRNNGKHLMQKEF